MPAGAAGIKAGRAFILIDAVDATGAVLNNVRRRFLAVGQELTNIGRGLFTKGIASMLPLGLAAKTFMDFDDAMKVVEARSEGTAEQMRELRQQALDLGEATAFTSSNVANLMAELAKKRFNRSEIQTMTSDILDLARAVPTLGGTLETDMVQAAKLTSGVLRAFNMEASDTKKVVDLLSVAVSSNFTLEDMIVALEQAAPASAEFNLSLEQTLAGLAALRDLNLEASVVGTSWRNMMTYMSKPKDRDRFNEQLSEATNKTIEFTKANKDLHDLPDILMAMGKAMHGLGTTEIGDMMHDLFGTRAQIPATALSSSAASYKQIMSRLMQADDNAKKVHATMESGAGGAWRETESVVERIGIAIGNAFEKPLIRILKYLQDFGRSATKFIDDNKGLITIMGLTAVGAIVLGAAIFSIGATIMFVTPILTFLVWTLGLVTSAFRILFITIPMLMVSFALGVWNAIGAVIVFMPTLWGMVLSLAGLVAEIWGAVIPALLAFAVALGTDVMAAMATMAGIFATFMAPFLAEILAGVIIFGALGAIILGIAYLIGRLPDLMRYFWDSIKVGWNFLGNLLSGMGQIAMDSFEEFGRFLYAKAQDIGETFMLMYRAVTAGIQSGELEIAWQAVVLGMKIVWLQLIDAVLDAWEALPMKLLWIFIRLQKNLEDAIASAKLEAALALFPKPVADMMRKQMGAQTLEERIAKWIAGDGGAANKDREQEIKNLQDDLKKYAEVLEFMAKAGEGHGEADRLLDPNLFTPKFDDLIKGGGAIGPALANEALYQGTHEAVKAASQNFLNADKGQIDRLNAIADHLRAIREEQNKKLGIIDEDLKTIAAIEMGMRV